MIQFTQCAQAFLRRHELLLFLILAGAAISAFPLKGELLPVDNPAKTASGRGTGGGGWAKALSFAPARVTLR